MTSGRVGRRVHGLQGSRLVAIRPRTETSYAAVVNTAYTTLDLWQRSSTVDADAWHVDHEIRQSTQHSQKYKVTEREACDLTTRGHKQDAPRGLGAEKAKVLRSALSQAVAQILI